MNKWCSFSYCSHNLIILFFLQILLLFHVFIVIVLLLFLPENVAICWCIDHFLPSSFICSFPSNLLLLLLANLQFFERVIFISLGQEGGWEFTLSTGGHKKCLPGTACRLSNHTPRENSTRTAPHCFASFAPFTFIAHILRSSHSAVHSEDLPACENAELLSHLPLSH